MELNLDLTGLEKEIKKQKKVRKIILQVPDGLKTKSQEIISYLEKSTNKIVYLSIEPVYGSCDLATNFMDAVGADLIVHFGHTEFKKSNKNVVYWPTFYGANDAEIKKLVSEIDKNLNNKKICIVGPIQYKKIIEKIEIAVKKAHIIKTKNTGLLLTNQILGCDTSILNSVINKIDCIIYFGDGNFHLDALNQNIEIYNLTNFKLEKYIPKNNMRKQIMSDYVFKTAKNIGILVTSKTGQNNYLVAEKLYEKIKKEGKNPYLLIADFISYDKILGLELDCLINTACPRIIDDKENYKIPIINYKDILK